MTARVAVILLVLCPAVASAAAAAGGAQATHRRCVVAEEAGARAAGGDEDGPPKFTRAFYARVLTIVASLDGLDGNQLPISIEKVCNVPRSLRRQAVQLAGADGVALVSTRTKVWLHSTPLSGTAATDALEDADTAVLRVRLVRPRRWAEDEDGNKIPTFKTRRIQITD